MGDNHELPAPTGHITDSEVAAAIRYLDPTPTSHTGESGDTVIVIVLSVFMLLLAAVPFISLYLKTS